MEMRKIHDDSAGTYGQPRMTPALRALGFCINHERVERLMQKHQIKGHVPKTKIITMIPAVDANSVTDLVKRDFRKQATDLAWCGDISYIRTWEGWLYLATVIDLGSRRVIGYAMADHMRTELIEDAIAMAVKTRGRTKTQKVPFHSDRGSQYQSDDFAEKCKELALLRSVGRVATCFDGLSGREHKHEPRSLRGSKVGTTRVDCIRRLATSRRSRGNNSATFSYSQQPLHDTGARSTGELHTALQVDD